MKNPFSIVTLKLFTAGVLAIATPLSIAGGQPDVNWSISIGSPYPAPQVYAPPPVVYVQPQPVYVRPRPVYVQPAAVVQYGPTYYVEQDRHHKKHHRHERHRGHRHYDY